MSNKYIHFVQIRRHSYLIHSDPDNTQAILDNFQNLCGMDAKLILSKHPKIILTPWKTIRQIKKHFEVLEVFYNVYNSTKNNLHII